jgi:hypothetical protein
MVNNTYNKTIESAKDYVLESAIITADRSTDLEMDISKVVLQLDIFENIDLPYLTGNIVIKDESNLLGIIDIKGTERLKIRLSIPTSPETIEIKFVIEKIQSTVRYGDQAEMLVLKLIEEHAFNSAIQKISKAYTGKPEEIIASILKDALNIDLDNQSMPSAQGEMRVVIPYMTPLEACQWILSRMTTEYGAPYFLYSPMNKTSIILNDMQTILTEASWNYDAISRSGLPFTYNQASAQFVDAADIARQSFAIQSIKYTNTENTAVLSKLGAIGANYSWTDVTTGITESIHFNLNDALLRMQDVILKGNKQLTLDTEYLLNGVKISDLNSAYSHQILSRNSYPDVYNFYEETDIAKYILTATARAMRKLLMKSNIEISVPGIQFITGTNRSIGTNISILLYNSDISLLGKNGVTEEDLKDAKRSGDYMVYNTHHLFTLGKHNVVMYAAKLADEKVTQ